MTADRVDTQFDELLTSYPPEIGVLAVEVRDRIRGLIPDATEEFDGSDKLIGFTFTPGTYRGLILAVSPQQRWVNIIFSKGVELLEHDTAGVLEGTGKQARHIKVRSTEQLAQAELQALVEEAARRTPRS